MGYHGLYFNRDGNPVTKEPMELTDTIAVSVVLASTSINGQVLLVSRHWVLVGNDLERILVCQES